MDATYEVLAVDDGSTDLTAALLQRCHREWHAAARRPAARQRRPPGGDLRRARQRALGDYVVTIDADLQDPPEIIAQMLAKAAKATGVDVVYGVRNDRSTDTWFKRASAQTFYTTHRPDVRRRRRSRRRR